MAGPWWGHTSSQQYTKFQDISQTPQEFKCQNSIIKRTHQVLDAMAQNLGAQELCTQYHKQPSKSMVQFPKNLRRLSSYITQKENISVK